MSSPAASRRMPGFWIRWGMGICLLGAAAWAQDLKLEEMKSILSSAGVQFSSAEPSRAVPDLTRIIEAVSRYRSVSQLDPEIVAAYVKALEMRGLILYGLDEVGKAEADFSALVKVSPEYRLNSEMASPKIHAFYDGIRAKSVGQISVSSAPAVAEVLLDGQLIGMTPIIAKDLASGAYRLTVRLQGYKDFEEAIQILPDQTLEKTIPLEMNSGDCILFTVPSGVAVFMDGKQVGTTSGEAPEREAEYLSEFKMTPKQASLAFSVPRVPLGSHDFAFSKPGWSNGNFRAEVKVGENRFPPIVLDPSRCRISIASGLAGGKVSFGEPLQPLGTTPLVNQEVYAGATPLVVEWPGKGKWSDVLQLKKDESIELSCSPRPSLLFIGLFDEQQEFDATSDLYATIARSLDALPNLNTMIAGQPGGPAAPLPKDLAHLPKGERAEKCSQVAKATGADLALVALLPAQNASKIGEDLAGQEKPVAEGGAMGLRRFVVMELYADEHGPCDRRWLPLDDPNGVAQFVSLLRDAAFDLERPWMGLSAMDLELGPGATVVQVHAGSPAEKAGILVGDFIVKVNGKPVGRSREIEEAMVASDGGTALSLEWVRDKSPQRMDVRPDRSPKVLPLSNPNILYNQALKSIRLEALLHEDVPKEVVALNLAVCFMRFGEYDKAMTECLRGLSLPRKTGVGDGTVAYTMGECYRLMGYAEEAIKSYEQAASQEGSTFEWDGGLRVRPAALARLKELGR